MLGGSKSWRVLQRFSARGHQVREVVIPGCGQAARQVPQVIPRINLAPAKAHDHGVNFRAALVGLWVPDKQIVLLSKAARPERIFRQVVIDLQPPLLQIAIESLPLG